MRDIKFRIWDKKRKKFLQGESSYFPQNICFDIFTGLFNGCSPEDIRRNKSLILQQYTNLKDRNGKEIYEGDIVKWEITPLNIRYEDEWLDWEKRRRPKQIIKEVVEYKGQYIDPFRESAFGPYLPETCEVIGNIYENSKLCEN